MNNRIGRLDDRMTDRFNRLDDRMANRVDSVGSQIARNRPEMRRELLVIASFVTLTLGGLQMLIAWGIV